MDDFSLLRHDASTVIVKLRLSHRDIRLRVIVAGKVHDFIEQLLADFGCLLIFSLLLQLGLANCSVKFSLYLPVQQAPLLLPSAAFAVLVLLESRLRGQRSFLARSLECRLHLVCQSGWTTLHTSRPEVWLLRVLIAPHRQCVEDVNAIFVVALSFMANLERVPLDGRAWRSFVSQYAFRL